MTRPILIIVTGAPGTGKTTLSYRLAQEFGLPCIRKDDIKERLFDTLGWSDREWSRKLGLATYELLYYFVELHLGSGRPLIVESNFSRAQASAVFQRLLGRYAYTPFQILCRTEGPVLAARFWQRAASGERHPGHVEHQAYAELQPVLLQGVIEPLDIGGPVYELDTTDFAAIDYNRLFAAIHQALATA